MWCRHCQQDVPAVAQAASGGVQCARCHGALGRGTLGQQRPFGHTPSAQRSPGKASFAQTEGSAGLDPGAVDSQGEAVVFEPWKLADVWGPNDGAPMSQIGQQLRSTQARSVAQRPAERIFRVDAPQPAPAPPPRPPAPQPLRSHRPPAPRQTGRTSQFAAWVAALVGALGLGAGLGLLGWSLLSERPDLWNPGLATTLGGQGLMIVGLVQLLANLWTGSRDATNRLITLQYEMRRLQRTADSLAGMRSATPSAFYADLARGSSPQVLLASLRGQVDELTSRLSAR